MKHLCLLIVAIVGNVPLNALQNTTPLPATGFISIGARRPAPAFDLPDANGKSLKLSAFKGKVLLLDVWATWCTGCKQEMPWFMEFQSRYGKQGLQSLGVAMDDEGWAAVRPYLREHPINYPVATSNVAFSTAYKVTVMPITVLIDRRGRVADWHVGVVDKDEWQKEIDILLKER
jgi:cytochrome c biogenesis protein CcmG/thiol:disulfide interchange protein DsbE